MTYALNHSHIVSNMDNVVILPPSYLNILITYNGILYYLFLRISCPSDLFDQLNQLHVPTLDGEKEHGNMEERLAAGSYSSRQSFH